MRQAFDMRLFIRRNLSPGGCADLLAVSYFLLDWKNCKDPGENRSC